MDEALPHTPITFCLETKSNQKIQDNLIAYSQGNTAPQIVGPTRSKLNRLSNIEMKEKRIGAFLFLYLA